GDRADAERDAVVRLAPHRVDRRVVAGQHVGRIDDLATAEPQGGEFGREDLLRAGQEHPTLIDHAAFDRELDAFQVRAGRVIPAHRVEDDLDHISWLSCRRAVERTTPGRPRSRNADDEHLPAAVVTALRTDRVRADAGVAVLAAHHLVRDEPLVGASLVAAAFAVAALGIGHRSLSLGGAADARNAGNGAKRGAAGYDPRGSSQRRPAAGARCACGEARPGTSAADGYRTL